MANGENKLKQLDSRVSTNESCNFETIPKQIRLDEIFNDLF